jgi:hypothetical protein
MEERNGSSAADAMEEWYGSSATDAVEVGSESALAYASDSDGPAVGKE